MVFTAPHRPLEVEDNVLEAESKLVYQVRSCEGQVLHISFALPVCSVLIISGQDSPEFGGTCVPAPGECVAAQMGVSGSSCQCWREDLGILAQLSKLTF